MVLMQLQHHAQPASLAMNLPTQKPVQIARKILLVLKFCHHTLLSWVHGAIHPLLDTVHISNLQVVPKKEVFYGVLLGHSDKPNIQHSLRRCFLNAWFMAL